MTRDELLQLVTTHLDRAEDPWSNHPGAVLYSGLRTIRPGPFYVLGINPGGDEGPSIRDNLCADDGANHYADQRWDEERGSQSVLQERVCDLIDALGTASGDLPSTNLAFAKSTELAKLKGARAWFQRCWPVHQALLQAIRPRWIVMLGFGPAYEFVCARAQTRSHQQPIEAAGIPVAWHRRVQFDLCVGPPLNTGLLAVAHPSNRGFARAGLGSAHRYPDVLREFIAQHVRHDGFSVTA